MEKITFEQLRITSDKWKEAIIVFTPESFTREFSEVERSYKVFSTAKYFDSNMIGNSLYGSCLDGKDDNVRLDWYMNNGVDSWIVDYCYIAK